MKSEIIALKLMTLLMVGCSSLPATQAPATSLIPAQKFFAAGEFYQARKITESYLKTHPADSKAQTLMAKILDAEIAQHKEAFETKPEEELNRDEKSQAIKTWLERSRSLLEVGEYEQAAEAAERVFSYEAHHPKASALLDEIRQKAWTEGKREITSGHQIIKTEVDDRVSIYKKQAYEFLRENKPGAARLAAEKALLLAPDDEEALGILQELKTQKHS